MPGLNNRCLRGTQTHEAHHLTSLSTLLDVHNELLLLLLELGALTVELALRLCKGALVLPKPLGGSDRAAKEGFLWKVRVRVSGWKTRSWLEDAYDDVHGEMLAVRSEGDGLPTRMSVLVLLPRYNPRIGLGLTSTAMSASLGLPAIGAHCALPSCNLNDFLPIRCKCGQLYCTDHIPPHLHHCPLQHSTTLSTARPALNVQRCAAQDCTKPSLESFIANPSDTTNRSPAVCSGCTQAFCAQYAPYSSIYSHIQLTPSQAQRTECTFLYA